MNKHGYLSNLILNAIDEFLPEEWIDGPVTLTFNFDEHLKDAGFTSDYIVPKNFLTSIINANSCNCKSVFAEIFCKDCEIVECEWVKLQNKLYLIIRIEVE